jgi:hypothetical protein
MRSLLLSDLRLALPDLLDDKAELLEETHAGRLYAPRLSAKRDAIEALPEPTVAGGRPLAEELAETDVEHDGFGAAIWHYTEAVRLAPGMTEEARQAARAVREAFIPELALLGRSYATEAAHALGKRERIAEHKDALLQLPIPGNKKTLRAWVDGFVKCGETLDELLRARAQHQAATVGERGRREAGTLRADTIGLLGRMRSALADELADEPERLATVDAELFGYFDQLAADRDASLRRRAGAGGEDEAEPAPVAEVVEAANVA